MKMIFLEDDETIRKSYYCFLRIYFKKVYDLDNAKEALEILKKESIDFILTDINMQEMNGLEFIKEVRKENQNIPIVIMSAYDNKEYLHEAIKLGLINYLVKPIKISVLQDTINEVLVKLQKNYEIELSNNYKWNSKKRKLYLDEKEVTLTKNESLLFEKFCTKHEIIFSLEDISELIYPSEEYNSNKIRMIIKRLNKKLNYSNILENLHNIGYRFVVLR